MLNSFQVYVYVSKFSGLRVIVLTRTELSFRRGRALKFTLSWYQRAQACAPVRRECVDDCSSAILSNVTGDAD